MSNVFKFLKPKANLSRNGFDLSQRHIFSAKAGQLLPILALECIPGDYHEIDVLSLIRTLPIETDAFARLSASFQFVYVPYQQLWHDWNQFILQTEERYSYVQNTEESNVPFILYTDLLNYIFDIYIDYNNGIKTELTVDRFGYCQAQNALRMMDLLGYGSFYWIRSYVDSEDRVGFATKVSMYDGKKMNLFRIAAYQKFCQDYCRNVTYETADASLFSLDRSSGSSVAIDPVIAVRMFGNIQYVLWKKDMFTGLMPSPQFGLASSVNLGQFQLSFVNPQSSNIAVYTRGETGIIYPTGHYETSSRLMQSTAQIDVYQIRKAEMFQKWKEDRLRAGNSIRNQAVGMWGNTFKYAQDNYSDYIKEISHDISIDEVVNQSAQGSVSLGEIAGKGVGTGNGRVTFKCDDFGVLLCVFSVRPSSEYDAIGLDKNNTLMEPFDFATPHFENLGFEAVSRYQVNFDLSNIDDSTAANSTLGFAPRYLNYKTAVDKVHGEFMSRSDEGLDVRGSLNHWVTPRTDMEAYLSSEHSAQGGMLDLNLLYVNPKVLDSIFLGVSNSFQDTDQFLVNANFAVKSVRNLSVLGLPRW